MANYIHKLCDHKYGPLTDIKTGEIYGSNREALVALKQYLPNIWVTCEFCGERRQLRRPQWMML